MLADLSAEMQQKNKSNRRVTDKALQGYQLPPTGLRRIGSADTRSLAAFIALVAAAHSVLTTV